jgi:hypothetical protein
VPQGQVSLLSGFRVVGEEDVQPKVAIRIDDPILETAVSDFPVVGSSARGIGALRRFFEHMSPNSEMAVRIVSCFA